MPIHTVKQLYTITVQQHFDYWDMVYDSVSGPNKTRLQKLQARDARLMTGSDPHSNRVSMFKNLGWLSLQYRRDFHKCIMIYKCRNGLAPHYLCDLPNSNESMHSYNPRNSSQLRATKSCTAYYHHSFILSGLNLWNSLPRKYFFVECITYVYWC